MAMFVVMEAVMGQMLIRAFIVMIVMMSMVLIKSIVMITKMKMGMMI